MPVPIHANDKITCTGADAPAQLQVLTLGCSLDGRAAATVEDDKTGANISPMGTCKFLTAKALGVPTPCVPQPQGWKGPACGITWDNKAILTSAYTCACSEGGIIQVAPAGAVRVEVS